MHGPMNIKFIGILLPTFRSHLQGSRLLTLEEGTDIYRTETSVRNYHYSLRNNAEERRSLLLRGGSLKSHIAETSCIIKHTLLHSLFLYRWGKVRTTIHVVQSQL